MKKQSLMTFMRKEYILFFSIFLGVFITALFTALIFSLYQKNLQFCDSYQMRANDLSEIIARESLIGSASTIQFELDKLKQQFNLSNLWYSKENSVKNKYCKADHLGFNAILPITFGTQFIGEIHAQKKGSLNDIFLNVGFIVPFFLISFGPLLLFIYLNYRFKKLILIPIEQISSEVSKVSNFEVIKNDNLNFNEFLNLVKAINSMAFEIHSSTQKIKELELASKIADTARQVSHDIRSPLSALNMILTSLHQVAEDKRIVIRTAVQRINDIANQLLEKSKHMPKSSDDQLITNLSISNNLKIEWVAPLVDALVSEKRVQFREKQGVSIEAQINQGYGLFARVNSVELKRVLSNLINNSVEALPQSCGNIKIVLGTENEFVRLQIQDDGAGIPPSILEKLGQMGVSHGKEGAASGSGLGVYHAKKSIESFGGQMNILSKVGEGTVIGLLLPKIMAPSWFVEKLVFTSQSLIVTVDDDLSIHQVWQERIAAKGIKDSGVNHKTFTSGQDFKSWCQVNMKNAMENHIIYLMDYELLNQDYNGLDLIEDLGLPPQNTILVTSRYEELEIQSRCQTLGIKIIPKGMAPFVPIEILKPKKFYDCVLIDDDTLMEMTWQMSANSHNKKFVYFNNPEDFFKSISQISFESPLYIDADLGKGIRGTDLCKKAFDLGFKNIFLCTGYSASDFAHMPWVKAIVGKDPVF
ncbi:MAG: ATP-binding protein [Pseudobdellovibrionaceae bacterium]